MDDQEAARCSSFFFSGKRGRALEEEEVEPSEAAQSFLYVFLLLFAMRCIIVQLPTQPQSRSSFLRCLYLFLSLIHDRGCKCLRRFLPVSHLALPSSPLRIRLLLVASVQRLHVCSVLLVTQL